MLSHHLSVVLLCSLASALHVSIPVSAPPSAPSMSPSLFSFSIEQDRWTSWAGTDSPNTFASNAFDNLKQLTGEPPWIRIGANSEDRTNFDPAVQFSEAIFPPSTPTVPYIEASAITVGDGFYQVVANLLPGTRVIWGVNFAQDNITSAFLETRSIMKAFASSAVRQKGISLEYLEIGNEADLYPNHNARNRSTWNVDQYMEEWTKFALNVSTAAGLSANSGPKLLAGSFAESSVKPTGFSAQALIGGLLPSEVGPLITGISQHHYSGSFCQGNGDLLSNLMDKQSIRGNLSYFKPDAVATVQSGRDYFFGESNSYSCHGAPGVSNSAGAALWALDYGLFAPQVGISRVHFHEGIGFKYNFIQPVTLNNSILDGTPLPQPAPPHVQPSYYAAIIAAEAIGSSGATSASELVVDDPHVSGYVFFEGGSLARVVLINSEAFLTKDTSRNSKHIDVTISDGGGPSQMTVKRLAIGHADDVSGVTWGGQTYETGDARISGDLDVTTVPVNAGVDVEATEVVLLTFGHE